MTRAAALRIFHAWSQTAPGGLHPTPQEVSDRLGISWAEWCMAHDVVASRQDEIVPLTLGQRAPRARGAA